jgi:hypothetical protein
MQDNYDGPECSIDAVPERLPDANVPRSSLIDEVLLLFGGASQRSVSSATDALLEILNKTRTAAAQLHLDKLASATDADHSSETAEPKSDLEELQDLLDTDRTDRLLTGEGPNQRLTQLLFTSLTGQFRNLAEGLEPKDRQEILDLLGSPLRAAELVANVVKKQLRAVLETNKSELSNRDYLETQNKIDSGEIPIKVLRLWAKEERVAGQCGPATMALYETLCYAVDAKLVDIASQAVLRGNEVSFHRELLDDSKAADLAKTPLARLSNQRTALESYAVTEAQPKSEQISRLRKRLEWEKSFDIPENSQLQITQRELNVTLPLLSPKQVREAVITQQSAILQDLFSNGTLSSEKMDELRRAESKGQLQQECRRLATEQVDQLVSASGPIGSPRKFAELLEQESNAGVDGAFTRGILSAYTDYLKTRYPDLTRCCKIYGLALPQSDLIAAFEKEKAGLGKNSDSAKLLALLRPLEGWVIDTAGLRANNLTQFQSTLTQVMPIIDKGELAEELTRALDVKTQPGSGEVGTGPMLIGRVSPEDRLKVRLIDAVDRQGRFGLLDKSQLESVRKLINDGEIPNVALKALLSEEAGQYGPITKAVWSAAIKTVETESGASMLQLKAMNLAVPGNCMFTAREYKENTKKLKWISGISPDEPPAREQLERFTKAVNWTTQAREQLECNEKEYSPASLEDLIRSFEPKSKYKDWLPKDGQNRQEWFNVAAPLVNLKFEIEAYAKAFETVGKSTDKFYFHSDEAARNALDEKNFPGKIRRQKNDGPIEGVDVYLPKTLDQTTANRELVEKAMAWLAANREIADQAVGALADAAKRKDAVLLWCEQPVEGKLGTEKYNLARYRYDVSEETDKDGKPIICVTNRVDVYDSQWCNYENMLPFFEKKVGSLVLEDVERDSDGKRKETEVVSRKFKPDDLVAVVQYGQVQLIQAKNLNELKRWHEIQEQAGKVFTLVMDVGMVVTGTIEIGVAFRAGRIAAAAGEAGLKAGARVLREKAMEAAVKAAFSGTKHIALGGSGLLMNNAPVRASEWGKCAHTLRGLAMMADAGTSLARGGVGGARSAMSAGEKWAARLGWIQAETKVTRATETELMLADPVLGKTAKSLQELPNFGALPRKWLDRSNLFCELYTIAQLAGPIWHSLMLRTGLEKKPPGVKEVDDVADGIYDSRQGCYSRLTRFTDATLADAGIPSPVDMAMSWYRDIDRQTPEQRSQKLATLATYFSATKSYDTTLIPAYDSKVRLAAAVAILEISKASGAVPSKLELERNGKPITLETQQLYDFMRYSMKSSQNPEERMVSAQALLVQEKISIPEFMNFCRAEIKNKDNSQLDKLEAMMSLYMAVESIEHAAKNGGQALRASAQQFGCSAEDVKKDMKVLIKTSPDGEIRGFACAILQDWNDRKANNREFLLAVLQSKSADRAVQVLENSVKSAPTAAEKTRIQNRLDSAQAEQAAAIGALNVLSDHSKQAALVKASVETIRRLNDTQAEMLITKSDIKLFEAKLRQNTLSEKDKKECEQTLEVLKKESSKQLDDLRTLRSTLRTPWLGIEGLAESKSVESAVLSRLEEARQDAKNPRGQLEALKILSLFPQDKNDKPENRNENKLTSVSQGFVSLIISENGTVAVEALEFLLSDGMSKLTANQRKTVCENITRILLNADSSQIDISTRLLSLLASKYDAFAFSPSESKVLEERAAEFLSPQNMLGNANPLFSADPELRFAAAEFLGAINKRRALTEASLDLLRLRAVRQPDVKDGEPDDNVRRAALNAILVRETEYPWLPAWANDALFVEPNVSQAKRLREIAKLAPDAVLPPESSREKSFNSDQATTYLLNAYPLLLPTGRTDKKVQTWNSRYGAAEQAFSDKKAIVNALGPHMYTSLYLNPLTLPTAVLFQPMLAQDAEAKRIDMVDIIRKDTIGAVNKEQLDQWNKLCATAAKTDEEGQRARNALLEIATAYHDKTYDGLGLTDLPERSAKELLKLANQKLLMTDPRSFATGIANAFETSLTSPRSGAIRTDLLKLLEVMTLQNGQLEPGESAEVVYTALGHIVGKSDETKNNRDYLQSISQLLQMLDRFGQPISEVNGNSQKNWTYLKDVISLLSEPPILNDKQVAKRASEVMQQAKELERKWSTELNDAAFNKKYVQPLSELVNDRNDKTSRELIRVLRTQPPLQGVNDPRLPFIQKLLTDRQSLVQLSASKKLLGVEELSPNSECNLPYNSPARRQAYQTLQSIAKREETLRAEALDAVKVVTRPYSDISKPLEKENSAFADAKSTLLSTADQSAKKLALKKLFGMINAGANERDSAEDVLRMISRQPKDESPVAADEIIREANAVSKPKYDYLDASGKRQLGWDQSGKCTQIEYKGDRVIISYGFDGKGSDKTLELVLDGKGSVLEYSVEDDNTRKQTLKQSKNFAPGSIKLLDDGSVFFDNPDGTRRVISARGFEWSYSADSLDWKACAEGLKSSIQPPAAVPDLRRVLDSATPEFSAKSVPISNKEDARIQWLRSALTAEGDATKRLACAKALLDPWNSGIPASVRMEAKRYYCGELEKRLFITESDATAGGQVPAKPQALLRELNTLCGLDAITYRHDPRVGILVKCLHHENADVRVFAAREITSSRHVLAFSDDTKQMALQSLCEEATGSDSAFRYNRAATAKALADALAGRSTTDLASPGGGHIKFEGNLPVEVRYFDGSKLTAKWNGGELMAITTKDGISYSKDSDDQWHDSSGKSAVSVNLSNTGTLCVISAGSSPRTTFATGAVLTGDSLKNPDGSRLSFDKSGCVEFSDGYKTTRKRVNDGAKQFWIDYERKRLPGYNGFELREQQQRKSEIQGTPTMDYTTGSIYLLDDKRWYAKSIYGGTLTFNVGGMPTEYTLNGEITKFEYRPGTNIVSKLTLPDGTQYELQNNKFVLKRPDAPEQIWTGTIAVDRSGEYYLKDSGVTTRYRLDGRKEVKPDGTAKVQTP